MIVKGIVSAIYKEDKKLSVILPEYGNLTTNPIDVYGNSDMDSFAINDFVVVAVFNDNLTDAIVLSGVSEFSAKNEGDLFYVYNGRVTPLKLGTGLVIVSGVLCLKDKLTATILGSAILGDSVLGLEE